MRLPDGMGDARRLGLHLRTDPGHVGAHARHVDAVAGHVDPVTAHLLAGLLHRPADLGADSLALRAVQAAKLRLGLAQRRLHLPVDLLGIGCGHGRRDDLRDLRQHFGQGGMNLVRHIGNVDVEIADRRKRGGWRGRRARHMRCGRGGRRMRCGRWGGR
jgi:hypothetical protein